MSMSTDTTAFFPALASAFYEPIEPGRADSRAFYNRGCGGREYQPGQIKGMTMSVS